MYYIVYTNCLDTYTYLLDGYISPSSWSTELQSPSYLQNALQLPPNLTFFFCALFITATNYSLNNLSSFPNYAHTACLLNIYGISTFCQSLEPLI